MVYCLNLLKMLGKASKGSTILQILPKLDKPCESATKLFKKVGQAWSSLKKLRKAWKSLINHDNSQKSAAKVSKAQESMITVRLSLIARTMYVGNTNIEPSLVSQIIHRGHILTTKMFDTLTGSSRYNHNFWDHSLFLEESM